MNLRERFALIRETRDAYNAAIAAGKTPEEAHDEALSVAHDKYGASPNWANIIAFILKILQLLLPLIAK